MSERSAARTDRRKFLAYLGVAAGGAAVGAALQRYGWTQPPTSGTTAEDNKTPVRAQTTTERVTETVVYPASLRAAAEAKGLLVGSQADEATLKETRFATTLAREFNCITASSLSWAQVDRSGYKPTDALVKFAPTHEMKVKGHTLIWHGSLPSWISERTSASTLRSTMQKHIREEVARYKGKIYAWNVVNEAVENDGLRKTILLEKLGEGYIGEAFQLAHEADPYALLFYNDYNAEAAGGLQKAKSDRVYELVKKLVSDGVPIHGVGLQMHLFGVEYPRPEDIAANVRRLAALGLEVQISEMDVRIRELPLAMSERLEMQRRIYHDVIAACVREKGFTGVTFWGVTDAYWTNELGESGTDYPLLLDENYQPKPAYWGVMDALLGR